MSHHKNPTGQVSRLVTVIVLPIHACIHAKYFMYSGWAVRAELVCITMYDIVYIMCVYMYACTIACLVILFRGHIKYMLYEVYVCMPFEE